MKDKALFSGFDEAKQAEYEKQLIERFGEKMRKGIAQSRRRVKDWTKGDWERSGQEWDAICREMVGAMKRRLKPDSIEVQQLVARHYDWLKQFWTPNQESYAGHGEFILTSELRTAYDKYDRGLAQFIRSAIKVFAQERLA